MIFFSFAALLALSSAAPWLTPIHPVQNTGKDSYIIGGIEADPGQFPFQGALLLNDDPTSQLLCGAVYIGEDWVLCAAHCTPSTSRSVWFGIHKRSETEDGEHRTFVRVVNHPDYGTGPGAFPNDISVLQMTSPVEGPNISAADLPYSGDFSGEIASIPGWGVTCTFCSTSDELMYSNVPVLSNRECYEFWGDYIADGHICFYDDNTSICAGDSGGAMSINNLVIGIGSWQPAGCDPAYPSGFTRVTHYRDWIEEVTGI